MMNLGTVIPYLKKIQKLYESRDTPLEFCWHQHFFTGNQQILLYQEIQIQIPFRYIISNSSNFSWVFKDFIINMVTILIMSAKMATPGFLEIKPFWKKAYDVIIYVDDVIKKNLLPDLYYNVNVVMWPKFGNSTISVREVIITSILWGFDQKNRFFWGVVLVRAQ